MPIPIVDDSTQWGQPPVEGGAYNPAEPDTSATAPDTKLPPDLVDPHKHIDYFRQAEREPMLDEARSQWMQTNAQRINDVILQNNPHAWGTDLDSVRGNIEKVVNAFSQEASDPVTKQAIRNYVTRKVASAIPRQDLAEMEQRIKMYRDFDAKEQFAKQHGFTFLPTNMKQPKAEKKEKPTPKEQRAEKRQEAEDAAIEQLDIAGVPEENRIYFNVGKASDPDLIGFDKNDEAGIQEFRDANPRAWQYKIAKREAARLAAPAQVAAAPTGLRGPDGKKRALTPEIQARLQRGEPLPAGWSVE